MSDYTPNTPQRRTGLQKTRDVALTVMAILVSLVSAVLLYTAIAAGSAIAELGKDDPTPAPAINWDLPTEQPIPTNSAGEECIGEVEIEGC